MEIQRESIFVSAIRSFCKMFFSVCGLLLAFFLVSILYGILSNATEEPNELKTNLHYLPDANGDRVLSQSCPVVLQINIHGVIGDPKGGVDTKSIEHILLDSRNGPLAHDRVKAILLHMNTPGGTVVDADNIYRMLQTYKERYQVPIFAYIDGLCASGGMYISCAAEQMFAGPASITGSVGVIIGPFFNIANVLDKVGIASETITEGKDKDMMSPFRPWKTNEDASLKAVTSYFYQQFVDLVVHARPRLDRTKLVEEYGANVFDCATAERYGYVDVAHSSRSAALSALIEKAGIDPAKPYQVVELEPKSEWLSTIFNSESPLFTGKIEHSIDSGSFRIRDQIAYLYQP